MKKIKINLEKLEKKDIEVMVDYLKKGKVIAYPTDTIYGLGCIATNEKGIKSINKLKKRAEPKPFIVLVDSVKMAEKYARISEKQAEYLINIWPGPVTVIFEAKKALPGLVTARQDTIAMRLPKNSFLITMLSRIDVPLISTSLNIAGETPINGSDEINYTFVGAEIDLVIDAGPLQPSDPSRIIDIRDINNIKIIRE